MTQRRALQTRILKTENDEKCWLHHCTGKVEEIENHLEYPTASGKPAALLQERGASAKRSQADFRKSLMSSSSQEPSAPEKLAALFSFGNEEPGNPIKSSVFKHTDPSNLRRSLLEGNKDHLLDQARSDLMKQEHQVGSLNICISELQQQAYAQRLRCRTHKTDILNLDENKFVFKKNYL